MVIYHSVLVPLDTLTRCLHSLLEFLEFWHAKWIHKRCLWYKFLIKIFPNKINIFVLGCRRYGYYQFNRLCYHACNDIAWSWMCLLCFRWLVNMLLSHAWRNHTCSLGFFYLTYEHFALCLRMALCLRWIFWQKLICFHFYLLLSITRILD